MNHETNPEHLRDEYLSRLNELYSKVDDWVRDIVPKADIEEERITIKEEPIDAYQAKVLVIKRPNRKTVRLIPRGRWIIGAEGRVDMKSDLGTETLIYVSEGAPTIRIDLLTENGKILEERESHPYLTDIVKGWVFLQNRQLGMLPSLNADLFYRLIEVLGR
ncbi:MAG: hypothetical protein AB1656_19895 [Candidatus Omnitrophota bacterium]